MEILRVPPYNTVAKIEVSQPLTDYEYTVEDMVDHSVSTGTVTSSDIDVVSITLPSDYDNQFLVTVDGIETIVDVVRPYVDPNTKGNTASEIAEYARHEEFARAIIDSVIPEGFYYQKKILQTTGLGADYLPLWLNAKKILQVYENNVLMFDSATPEDFGRTYSITKDNTAIVQDYNDAINRYEGQPILIPLASSDSQDLTIGRYGFHRGFDYTLLLTVGYQKIPSDIVKATELLIEDIACGKLEYFKRGISSYSNDDFRISYEKFVFEGTGNILVDKILSKYAKSIRTVGVL